MKNIIKMELTKESTHFVYILLSKDNRFYTGYTTNLIKRFNQHQSGKGAKFTRAFGAKEIVYQENFKTKSEALKREMEIKKLTRTDKEKLIKKRL